MEVILLWFDDLDDAVFGLALAWERARLACLSVGLHAAFLLAVCEVATTGEALKPALAGVAAAAVTAWLGAAPLRVWYRARLRPASAAA